MGLISCFLLLFILFISASDSILSAQESSDLIQQTCKNTKHYDFCVLSLQSDSSGPKADAKELALVMVRMGIANATETISYLLRRIREGDGTDGENNTAVAMTKAMRECADKYGYANAALQNSERVMSVEMYDYAYLHVMAAGDYPSACRHAFKRVVYPAELAVREDGLKHICDVAMGIIDSINY